MFDERFTKYKSYCAELGFPFLQTAHATIETDNMLFMMNESIKFNDVNGTNDTAIYLVPVLYDDILKYKIRRSDDAD